MIIRPDGLEIVDINLEFNFKTYLKLEIDMAHVNKDGRSNFTKDDVARIAIFLLTNLVLTPSDEKEFGEEICSYFVRTSEFEKKNYKLVFCICSDRPDTIGIITLHRLR